MEDSVSRAIWKLPLTSSILAKFLAEAGVVCNISDTQANGWTGLLKKEFSLVKSVTILTLLPLGLTTKNAGEHNSVGS